MVERPQQEINSKKWFSELTHPHEIIYESIFASKRLMNLEKFDLIFCAGVLYHTVEHFKLLNILRRLLKNDGLLLLQSTVYLKYKEELIFLRWEEGHKHSGAFPTKSALIKMLMMTGWDNIKIYVDYRPKSAAILLSCEKSKNLVYFYDGLPFGGSTV